MNTVHWIHTSLVSCYTLERYTWRDVTHRTVTK